MNLPETTYGSWYQNDTQPIGWQCGSCQRWVSFGAVHQCASVPGISTDERIAAALERIALTLEYMQQMQAGTTQTPLEGS